MGRQLKKLVDKPHIEPDRKVYPARGEEPAAVSVRCVQVDEENRHPLACIKYNKAITQFSKDSGEGGISACGTPRSALNPFAPAVG
jgi:hypothetical protein